MHSGCEFGNMQRHLQLLHHENVLICHGTAASNRIFAVQPEDVDLVGEKKRPRKMCKFALVVWYCKLG